MAQLSTRRTEVEAGPRRVWSIVTDPAHMAAWLPGVDAVTASRPLTVDAPFRLRVGPIDRDATVVDADEPAVFAFRTVSRGVATTYRYEIEADGPGSIVTVVIDVRPASPWGWFVTPLARRAIRHADRDHGERIRTAVLDAPW